MSLERKNCTKTLLFTLFLSAILFCRSPKLYKQTPNNLSELSKFTFCLFQMQTDDVLIERIAIYSPVMTIQQNIRRKSLRENQKGNINQKWCQNIFEVCTYVEKIIQNYKNHTTYVTAIYGYVFHILSKCRFCRKYQGTQIFFKST